MKNVARPLFRKNLVLVSLLLLLVFVAIQLGLLQPTAYATAWQVYYCDPNTGPQMVEATVVDDTNNRELRGDYDDWYVVDADSSPDESGYAYYKATEDSTVEVYGDVNVIITDNTKWVVERIHLNNGSKLTIWSETGNKSNWGKLSANTTEDHEAALSVGEGSTLVINGCKVDAASDTDDAAGIGGDKGMSAGTIIINDGDVFGRSKMNAAGIGAGKRGANGGTITINGGSVTGQARDEDGAGIGGSEGGEGGTITINGGTVDAQGAEAAAGIGGGFQAPRATSPSTAARSRPPAARTLPASAAVTRARRAISPSTAAPSRPPVANTVRASAAVAMRTKRMTTRSSPSRAATSQPRAESVAPALAAATRPTRTSSTSRAAAPSSRPRAARTVRASAAAARVAAAPLPSPTPR